MRGVIENWVVYVLFQIRAELDYVQEGFVWMNGTPSTGCYNSRKQKNKHKAGRKS